MEPASEHVCFVVASELFLALVHCPVWRLLVTMTSVRVARLGQENCIWAVAVQGASGQPGLRLVVAGVGLSAEEDGPGLPGQAGPGVHLRTDV